MNKDFVTIPNVSGNNNGSFDVTCEQNSGSERSTSLTISGGGVSKALSITQKGDSFKDKEFVIALGNNLLKCNCISDTTGSGNRVILLQAKSIATTNSIIRDLLEDSVNFYVGVYSVDGDTIKANTFDSLTSIRADLYLTNISKPGNTIYDFPCLYYSTDRDNLIYNLGNIIATPTKNISITGAGFIINIVFTDTTMEYWNLSGCLFINKTEGVYGDLACITYPINLTDENKVVYWRSPQTVNSGDGVQIVGFDIVPIAKTLTKVNNCKQYIFNDDADYQSLVTFGAQVVQYPDSPIQMSLNTTTNNKQFEFELHRWK